MTSPQFPLILGLTGPFGSGASTIAQILNDRREFEKIEPHTIIQRERKLDPDSVPKDDRRMLFQDGGNALRKEKGLGWIVSAALAERADKSKPAVIDSLKNPAEVQELHRQPNSCVVAICADEEIRWNRVYADGKYDNKRAFARDDTRDKYEPDPCGQDVRSCVDQADIVIVNNVIYQSSAERTEALAKTIGQYLDIMENPGSRPPSEAEVFMSQAYQYSLFSRCIKRQVGAVITTSQTFRPSSTDKPSEEREIVISGACNRVPPGQEECAVGRKKCSRDEGYEIYLGSLKLCPYCGAARNGTKSRHCPKCGSDLLGMLPGKALDVCRALHAEENAIVQVAHLGGISLDNATLYTTTFPCQLCAKKIAAAGIRKVVWLEPYPHAEAGRILREAGVKCPQFEGVKSRGFTRLFAKPYIA